MIGKAGRGAYGCDRVDGTLALTPDVIYRENLCVVMIAVQ